jgi:hypothetical protein
MVDAAPRFVHIAIVITLARISLAKPSSRYLPEPHFAEPVHYNDPHTQTHACQPISESD